MKKKAFIICFGEVLWDMLPTGKVAGGAPMNVAFHAKNFGMNAQLISAVGNDELGKELLDFLQEKGMTTDLVHVNYTFSTSKVQVTLDENGSASYEIIEPIAWDFLYADNAIVHIVEKAGFLLFGSLVCRKGYNIKPLLRLIENAKKTVFDVNLRPPFYSQDLIEMLLQKADIVKMNDEELNLIFSWYESEKGIAEQMGFLMEKFQIETLVMTKGKDGAYCMHQGQLFTQKSFPVKVEDTVGSGDSFLAAFIYMMSKAKDWQQCLEFACATGALVATKSGGTPHIDEKTILDLIKEVEL